MAFVRTVRALEAAALTQAFQRLLCDHVSAGHHHRGVFIRGLLFGDGTDEDGVEQVRRRKRDFDLYVYVSCVSVMKGGVY